MKGTLFGIGVGSGDGGELTLNAIGAVKNCDVLCFPSKNQNDCIAYKIISGQLSLDSKKLCFFDFPMTKDEKLLEKAHAAAAKKICEQLEKGKNVGFLTLGDPTVYSTYFYIHKKVIEGGFDAKIISGISSVFSAAAKLGINLTQDNSQLHIVPGDWELGDVLELQGTVIFMKFGKRLGELKRFLQNHQSDIEFLGAIANCGLENEKIFSSLPDLDENSGYLTVVIARNVEKARSAESYKFFQNRACKNFSCHKTKNPDDFNCLFCYCPLYALGTKCGGNFKYTKNGTKSCIDCDFPHIRENYDKILKRFGEIKAIMKL